MRDPCLARLFLRAAVAAAAAACSVQCFGWRSRVKTFRPPSWRVRPCWYHRVHTTRDESRLAPWLCHPSRAKLCVCRTQPGRLRACHGAPCVQPAVHDGVVGNACPVYTAVSCSVMGQHSLHYGVPRCCYRFFLCKTTPPGPNGEPLFYCVEITRFLAQCTHFSTRRAAETILVATSLNAVRCAAEKKNPPASTRHPWKIAALSRSTLWSPSRPANEAHHRNGPLTVLRGLGHSHRLVSIHRLASLRERKREGHEICR